MGVALLNGLGIGFLLGLGVALSGCERFVGPGTGASGAIAALPASATPTAAAPTPTPTATPLPTATVTQALLPLATATPRPLSTPTPGTARSSPPEELPAGPLSLEPAQVAQGKTAVIRVRARAGEQVQGTFDGAPLIFAQGQDEAWAVVGISGLASPGPRSVQVRVGRAGRQSALLQATLEVLPAPWPVEQVQLPPGQGELLAPDILRAEFALVQAVSRQAAGQPRWQGKFSPPLSGSVSSPFGIRRAYNGGPPSDQHQGMDFVAEAGAPVRAAAAGTVALARPLQVRGNAVLIDHGAGVVTGYYHLSDMLVQEGQEVAQGALLGRVGATGLATGPHLHWDLVISGVHVDPSEWLERAIP